MQGELGIRKKMNILFLIGMIAVVTLFFVDLNRFTPDHDIAFLVFGIATFLVGFGIGATWILNKWVITGKIDNLK